jgi:tRNA-specific 2-thiouridylase
VKKKTQYGKPSIVARVVLAMSGGVDSSVAAHLLQKSGHEVIGVFMRHGEETTACPTDGAGRGNLSQGDPLPIVDARQASKQGCCTARDALDARRVADRLDIPFYALNLQADFRRIIDYFVDEYQHGRTPNPCVMCNNWIKFGKLFDYADSVDAEFVATGHYARLAEQPTAHDVALLRGIDTEKDQSYVLFGIQRERLPRMMLPVGGYEKSEIRHLATQIGLRVADKPDSQEICFVASGKHAQFVRDRGSVGQTDGEIVTTTGRVVGHHPGIEGFTIGQRKGLGVAMGEPYFVVRIEPQQRRVVIGSRQELACRSLTAKSSNWLVPPHGTVFACHAQIRYNSQPQAARARLLSDDEFQIDFDHPCLGVAPGQAVVCYDGDRVLGGGWIEKTSP